MTVAGMLPELQCDHDQLVCPLQNITCQCGVTEMPLAISWFLGSEGITQFDSLGQSVSENTNYSATAAVVGNGLLSNLSLHADPQSSPVTVHCEDAHGQSNTLSYSVIGLFSEIPFFPIQSIK